MARKEQVKKPLWREILEWIVTIVVALVLATALRTFVFEPVKVDGESMLDTLQNKEIMFVSKYHYSTAWVTVPEFLEWLIPETDEQEEAAQRLTFFGNPERFDVVVCRYPGRGETNFVKRIVGVPGDTVQFREGYLYVNGEKIEEPYINDEYRHGYRETTPSVTLGEGEYFAAGDHRNNSNDSRSVGPITRDMIVGRVEQVIFPFSAWRPVQ